MCVQYVPSNYGNKRLGALAKEIVDNSMKVDFPL